VHAGETVRVLRKTDVSVVLHNVQLIGDSIVGDAGEPPQRTAIAVSDVQMITTRQTDTSVATTGIKTAGIVVVAVLAAGLLAIAEFASIFK